jgi:methylmalonyl-CoA/ethylmalonyl-CoA epimerase
MSSQVGPIDHVAVVVASVEEALPRYSALFGLQPDAPPREFAPQRVRLAFLPTGPDPAARIELIEPLDEESGVGRFLAARGEGLHHVCFRTDDLGAMIDELSAAEAELIDSEPRPGALGLVAFIHPRALNGVLWELLEPPR